MENPLPSVTEDKRTRSPRWSSTTKLLVGLVIIGIIAFLISRFQSLITPLLLIFIIAYLFHPLTAMIANGLGISWKASVNILYIVIFISLLGLLTVGGIGLVQQVQSLISAVQAIIADLPSLIEELSEQVFVIGPFQLDLSTIEVQAITDQLLSIVQPLLGRTGNLVGAVAGGAFEVFGWMFFVLIVSYFVMSESSGFRGDLIRIELPGYSEDLRRLGIELSRIWNAFLRGQIIIFILTFIIYVILLSVLGVRYALGLALMAGVARFLPYIGPAITWVVMALVTFFQASNPFGLEAQPLLYTAIVVGMSLVIDQIMDNLVSPRVLAQTLRVHPAAVLIAALIMANLLGVLGVVIAAPSLASMALLGRYTMRKMFDLEPFPIWDSPPPPQPIGREWLARLRHLRGYLTDKLTKNSVPKKEEPNEQ
jgi:predicted PurR-regulated permease PerM